MGSVEAMASAYADYAVKVAGSRPVIFGGKCHRSRILASSNFDPPGWSFGGVIGFEAARQLMKRGVPVKGVVLIRLSVPGRPCPLIK